MGNELVKRGLLLQITCMFDSHTHTFIRRKGLECRRQFCEPVGAWFTQLGELNTVYHMWTYPYVLTLKLKHFKIKLIVQQIHSDLQTRKTTREDAWNTEGWPETVYKTGKDKFHIKYNRQTH